MPIRTRAALLAVVALLTMGTATACTSAVAQQDNSTATALPPGHKPPQGGTLRVGVLNDLSPKTFLQIGTGSMNGHVVSNVFDTLIRYSRDDLTVRPSLATRWQLAPDGRSLTLDLRDDVRYHDGRAFTSADVESSLKAYTAGPWTPQFKRTAAAITGYDTSNPHRVVLTFDHPLSNIFDLLDSAPIIDGNTLDGLRAGKVFNGTGPFRFASWQPNSDVHLVRNDSYWGPRANLDGVDLDIITDQQALYTRLRTGQIDLAYGLNNHDQELATRRYGFSAITYTGAESQEYVGINVSNPALSDVRLRKAIAFSIDRERIINDVFRKSGYVVNLPWPKWSPAYDASKNTTYTRDVTKARRLVAEHGPVAPITLDYSTQGVDRVVAQIVQSNLKDVGIPVQLRPNDNTVQSSKLIGGKFDGIWLLQHGFAQFTPSTLAVSAYPFNAAKNSSNYVNPDYAKAANAAWNAPDPTSPAALAAYRQLDDIWLNDLFLVEIGVVFQQSAASPAVGNIDWDRRAQLHLGETYLNTQGRNS
ncbi:ABC transporter substrate-binding protein [Gordonia otitidis]|uniref:ABC transporter substrate binding protein n=1 Tax=Gordonia otitidis (strain DSM 44809 / CCUG 52243 / JCM 12355 / NBRC 100426 / IFM 10032) TaxID=1108044 RepID=H5TG65_GORO1|nr:ABC transporter substrate-binding protein [Gordonia otitidis]UEA60494.1 ABC transporter substrate-binding protein [Gordonia otitidis]GAB32473.1 putative ABC transporter substrate binding protein [Gordonia otitidis NBRC 100426]